ncbi:hypothetical protein CRYUN_Cryun35bG0079500 [Craigia yunnanensis]
MVNQQEEEDLRMALRMCMQNSPPEPKRSKPREAANLATTMTPEESQLLQRELMAAAAEKRMLAAVKSVPVSSFPLKSERGGNLGRKGMEITAKEVNLCNELSEVEAYLLFLMVFGSGVSKDILAQWSNQGIRFSLDQETSMGLVQHAACALSISCFVQSEVPNALKNYMFSYAFVLKHLFFPDELVKAAQSTPQDLSSRRLYKIQYVASNNFAAFTEDSKARALVKSMAEILFICGNNKRAVIATLSSIGLGVEGSEDSPKDMIIAQALESLSIESASDLRKVLRVGTYTTPASSFKKLEAMISVFQSRMGALLFLISALLSRGLLYNDFSVIAIIVVFTLRASIYLYVETVLFERGSNDICVQADRDDPSLPLVTAPFGHASKGISTNVEVGFLTLLESLNFCKLSKMRMNWKKENHRSAKLLMPKVRVEVVASLVWKVSIRSLERRISDFHLKNLISFAAQASLFGVSSGRLFWI